MYVPVFIKWMLALAPSLFYFYPNISPPSFDTELSRQRLGTGIWTKHIPWPCGSYNALNTKTTEMQRGILVIKYGFSPNPQVETLFYSCSCHIPSSLQLLPLKPLASPGDGSPNPCLRESIGTWHLIALLLSFNVNPNQELRTLTASIQNCFHIKDSLQMAPRASSLSCFQHTHSFHDVLTPTRRKALAQRPAHWSSTS